MSSKFQKGVRFFAHTTTRKRLHNNNNDDNKTFFNEDSLLKTYQIQTYSACNIETPLYTTRSTTKQWKNWSDNQLIVYKVEIVMKITQQKLKQTNIYT